MGLAQLTSQGIKNELKNIDYREAIGQYIWNGFDAEATFVKIVFDASELGGIQQFKIIDNGHGIDKGELAKKFDPVFDSEKHKAVDKALEYQSSDTHGRRGVGRFTFFHFALYAEWETIYKLNNMSYRYSIKVSADNLIKYEPTQEVEVDSSPGTVVSFTGISELTCHRFDNEIQEYLKREFAWFLELNKDKNYFISINENILNYSTIVGDKKEFDLSHESFDFHVKYLRWNESMIDELSKHYFIDSKGKKVAKRFTKLNRKGDSFYHSLFIKSSFFNDYVPGEKLIEDEPTLPGFVETKTVKDSKFISLMKRLEEILDRERKPFLREASDSLIIDFEKNGVIPEYRNEWEFKYKKPELINVVRGLYEIEPRLFNRLSLQQKKIFVRLLNLILDIGEKDKIFDILEEVIDLDSSEREEMANLLKNSSLSNIIKTIKLIEDRCTAIKQLKSLVFDENFGTNEPKHIQKFIESHYWIFGEQYHLVTAAEPDFEEALRRYDFLLKGENKKGD